MVADAVLFAVRHRRREFWLAWPTVKAITGERIVPGYVDRYLAEHGYDAQQTDVPLRPDRRDNLYTPLEGDHGAHGSFDARAKRTSLEWWLSKNRAALFGGVGAMLAFAAIAFGAPRALAALRA